MKIGIVGLGLIGGSLALTLKKQTPHEVFGYDVNASTMERAQAAHAIDARIDPASLDRCDVVLVAIPPAACKSFLMEHAHRIAAGTLVVDCCGVKRSICTLMEDLARIYRFHFVGGHPMAGRECSGFESAKADLFARASMLLTPFPGEDPAVIVRAESLFSEMGFLRVVVTTPEKHDEIIALTSQLAHVISNAYVKSPRAQEHRGFSAGSFADLTRVAKLDEHLWTELFLDNRDCLIREIDGFLDALKKYRKAIAHNDAQELCALLRTGRECKESL